MERGARIESKETRPTCEEENLTRMWRRNGRGSGNRIVGKSTRVRRGDKRGRRNQISDRKCICRNLARVWIGDKSGRG